MENINRKHFRCYRKLQLWRVFHTVLAEDWMRLLPIQTFKSVKRKNVSDSMYLLLSGIKSMKNRYYCLLCFHWPENHQIHLNLLRLLSCIVLGIVHVVNGSYHHRWRSAIPVWALRCKGRSQRDASVRQAVPVWSCLGSCFPKWRRVCPPSPTSGRAVGISELLLWDKWDVEQPKPPAH